MSEVENKKCYGCKQEFKPLESYLVRINYKDGSIVGYCHEKCLIGVECTKCKKIIVNPYEDGAQVISPMWDRDHPDKDDLTRIWICRSCFKIVEHFVLQPMGIESCS